MENKKVLMVMPAMLGGGAERVASLLLNQFNKNGIECRFVLTSSSREEVVNTDLDSEIPIVLLKERENKENIAEKFFYRLLEIFSSLLCKPFEMVKRRVPAAFAYISFYAQYRREIKALHQLLAEHKDYTVITFLLPAIQMVLLAARGLPNRVIVSERADPVRMLKKRYGYNFVRKYYKRADALVFQTDMAKSAYPEEIGGKGVVIPNPAKRDLPEAYNGEREKYITTFCRISAQKNLPLLIEAFAELHKKHPQYKLKIIGSTQNKHDEETEKQIVALIEGLGLKESIIRQGFCKDVHRLVIKDSVYVNSSDYEGMSNAMLEAMAIGMPVVCTDCPIGGASAVITDNENGLLVGVGDKKALSEAIERIITDKELSQRLSRNAAKLRVDLSLENIGKKWMELL